MVSGARGAFRMGGDPEALEREERLAEVSDFPISKYPITYKQFQAFIDAADGYRDPIWWQGLHADGFKQHKAGPDDQHFKFWNHPRENVSWYAAMAFCRWLTAKLSYEVRLPTEEEWERAARGTDGRFFPYGNEFDPGKGNTAETGIGQTSAVGIFPGGASPYGTLDMSGNVWEWTLTDYESRSNTDFTSNQWCKLK
ncbi:MAG: formylglycine-generating enzyme family protein [Aggregatilineales bacterium]